MHGASRSGFVRENGYSTEFNPSPVPTFEEIESIWYIPVGVNPENGRTSGKDINIRFLDINDCVLKLDLRDRSNERLSEEKTKPKCKLLYKKRDTLLSRIDRASILPRKPQEIAISKTYWSQVKVVPIVDCEYWPCVKPPIYIPCVHAFLAFGDVENLDKGT